MKAIEQMNNQVLGEKPVNVERYLKRAERPTQETAYNNVYVKDFPLENYTSEELREDFGQFGKITSCVVQTDENGVSRGFGFVCFETPEGAELAVKGHVERFGKKIFVCKAVKKSIRAAQIKKRTELYKNSLKKFNLYIKNFGADTSEEELEKFFEPFGPIRNVKIPKEKVQQPDGTFKEQNKGYGFVCFHKQEDAARAKKEAEKLLFQGQYLYVNFFENKESRQAKMEELRDKKKLQELSYQFGGGAGGAFPMNANLDMFTKMIYEFMQRFG